MAANNEVMIERLEKIERGELEPTAKDKNFYEHELREQELMDKGMSYEDAYTQTCKEYGIDVAGEKQNPFYTDEATKAWEDQIRRNLGF